MEKGGSEAALFFSNTQHNPVASRAGSCRGLLFTDYQKPTRGQPPGLQPPVLILKEPSSAFSRNWSWQPPQALPIFP